jgi:hypothetical protein
MTPEEHKILIETAQLAQENNAILKKLHRSMLTGRVMRVLYWIVIIGASLGAFYLIQPYLDSLKSLTSIGTSAQSAQNAESVQSLLGNLLGL